VRAAGAAGRHLGQLRRGVQARLRRGRAGAGRGTAAGAALRRPGADELPRDRPRVPRHHDRTRGGAPGGQPAVQFVEQDAKVTLSATQSAPTWGLDRIDQRSLPLSTTYTYGPARGVTAYVLDTGIRISQAEFAGRARYGWDFIGKRAKADDCNGHGTHVAGTIGGTKYGVAKDVNLVAVRVLDCQGSGRTRRSSTASTG
jgi:subtilisin family serine protease